MKHQKKIYYRFCALLVAITFTTIFISPPPLSYAQRINAINLPMPMVMVTPGIMTYEPRFNQIKTLTDPNGNIYTYTFDYELDPERKTIQ